jgi:cysteine-rich repeat protein
MGGIALACQQGSSTNQEHCFNNEGDQTCAELHGEDRPFCVGPGETCEASPSADGCVAELPPDECYSPCGNGALLGDDSSCLPSAEGDGDGDGDPTGDGDGDGEGDGEGDGDGDGDPAGDGDGDDPGPTCGDGMVSPDEECDDGNTDDDDECSNACTIAACGDGIIQPGLSETCDDGNTDGADFCSASCQSAGTVIWSRLSDLPNATGRSVTVATSGRIGIVAYSSEFGYRVISLDPDGEVLWNVEGPPQAAGIATGRNGQFVVGGVVDGKGQVWKIDWMGELEWTAEWSAPTSTIVDVAVDGWGSAVSVGSAYGLGSRARHDSLGDQEFLAAISGTAVIDAIAVAHDDQSFWVLLDDPRRIQHYSADNVLMWTSDDLSPLGDGIADLAVDAQGNAYLVGNVSGDLESFGVAKVDSEGVTSWASYHDDEGVLEVALAVAALPNGGVVTAGITNVDDQGAKADALLSWYGPDGLHMADYVFDGAQADGTEWFQGVAIDPEGNVVAVGYQQPNGGDYKLWTVKVAL